jgi:hypothetical protein
MYSSKGLAISSALEDSLSLARRMNTKNYNHKNLEIASRSQVRFSKAIDRVAHAIKDDISHL